MSLIKKNKYGDRKGFSHRRARHADRSVLRMHGMHGKGKGKVFTFSANNYTNALTAAHNTLVSVYGHTDFLATGFYLRDSKQVSPRVAHMYHEFIELDFTIFGLPGSEHSAWR